MSAGTKPPTCGFPTLALPHASVVIEHQSTTAQMWFSRTIGHPSHGGFCTPSRTRPTTVFVYRCAPIPWLHHLPPIPRLFLYIITHPPNDSFHTPPPTDLTAVFVHHRTPAQRWFSRAIVHPSHRGFCTPSPTHTIVVFTHHHPPISLQFLYAIAHPHNGGLRTPSPTHLIAVFVHHGALAQRRSSYTIVHPSHGGFCTPSRTRPTVVFTHYRPPISRQFLYTIVHPSHSGFCTPSPTRPVVFVHHRPPISWRILYAIVHPPHSGFFTVADPRRFLYTITLAPNRGFHTPLPLIVSSPWHLAYTVIQHDCVPRRPWFSLHTHSRYHPPHRYSSRARPPSPVSNLHARQEAMLCQLFCSTSVTIIFSLHHQT